MAGKITLTFLCTDIVGSTRHWEQQPEAMRSALMRQDAILRAAVETHHGWVFRTVGDALCAAFNTAPEALNAAVNAQRALFGEPWELDEPLRVRMVLHTGEAEASGGDYIGASLNRLGRMLNVCNGGQTLLTNATEQLVRDHLPPEVSLLDLGLHRFRDLNHPDRIFQVLIPGLPGEFPPLASAESYRTNLPLQLTPLVGRQDELAEILNLLTGSRLLTLTGPGGTGKTRLALAAAHQVRSQYPDGVFFISLSPLQDARLVPAAIAAELEVLEGSEPILERLKDALSNRTLLLVLDNFEHLLDAAPVVSTLLSAAPGLKVLVTSRARLRLQGERLYTVSPLAAPPVSQLEGLSPQNAARYPAVELFCQRAAAMQPSFELTQSNVVAVSEICNRLDGLPLALELAAARLPLFDTPQALLNRLEGGLHLLRAGNRDLPTRQHTLYSAIEWSYRLLSPQEQQLFCRLSVFAGGCTIETAAAIWEWDGPHELDILDGLEALLDKSLLRKDSRLESGPRFLMLRTIQEYARERLDESAEADRVRQAHAEIFMHLAETAEPLLSGPDQALWLERLEQEHNNLRLALLWSHRSKRYHLAMQIAAALAWFWYIHGYYSEGRQKLQLVLSQPVEDLEPGLRSRALYGLGSLTFAQGDYTAARRNFEEGLQIAYEAGDLYGQMICLSGLGDVTTYNGEFEAATDFYQQSLDLAERLEHPLGKVRALIGLGHTSVDHGRYNRAREFFERSLTAAENSGDLRHISRALNGLGYIASDQGDFLTAQSHFQRSLDIAIEIGDRGRMGVTLGNLGAVASDLSDYTTARSYYERSLAISEEIGDTSVAGIALANLSETEICLGNFAAAKAYNERARALAEKTGERRLYAITTYVTGEIDYYLGSYDSARRCIEQSVENATEIRDMRVLCIALSGLGQVVLCQGDPAGARDLQLRSLAIAHEIGESRMSAIAQAGLGEAALQAGDFDSARTYLQSSLKEARAISEKRQVGIVLNLLAVVDMLQGDYAAARTNLVESLNTSSQVGDRPTGASALSNMAALEVEVGAARRAARLWGAAQAQRAEMGCAVAPADRERFESSMERARQQLGEEVYLSEVETGGKLSLAEALELAIRQ